MSIMSSSLTLLAMACVSLALPGQSNPEIVLVTGATGRTGSLLYKQLKAQGHNVRGTYFRNVSKARELLGCGPCTEVEGIYQADVTNPGSLVAPFKGVKRVAIATGSFPLLASNGSYYFPKGGFPIDIDYKGCNNQVKAARAAGVEHILLISSMGTTQPDGFLDQMGHGWGLFYKLASEAYLESSGLSFTIVKPSGLTDSAAGNALLLVGHEDSITNQSTMSVTRGDVANVLVHAIQDPSNGANTRFDLSSDPSRPATDDFKALFAAARHL